MALLEAGVGAANKGQALGGVSFDQDEGVVGPVGLEPTTRGLKVRCSAN